MDKGEGQFVGGITAAQVGDGCVDDGTEELIELGKDDRELRLAELGYEDGVQDRESGR